jgi:hypothetical protein
MRLAIEGSIAVSSHFSRCHHWKWHKFVPGVPVILGELLAQHIENRTQLNVDRRLNLGGTFLGDAAVKAGQIDGYVEYTDTALTAARSDGFRVDVSGVD